MRILLVPPTPLAPPDGGNLVTAWLLRASRRAHAVAIHVEAAKSRRPQPRSRHISPAQRTSTAAENAIGSPFTSDRLNEAPEKRDRRGTRRSSGGAQESNTRCRDRLDFFL
jgi:hypothetical protein